MNYEIFGGYIRLSVHIVHKPNSFVTDELILIKLYTVTVTLYNLRIIQIFFDFFQGIYLVVLDGCEGFVI